MVDHYRKAFGVYAVSCVLFNHESPRRPGNFLSQKVIQWAKTYFIKGDKQPLQIGSLNSTRDWGHAKDYVKGIYASLQQEQPKDYILATGEHYSVRFFIEMVCSRFDTRVRWEGEGVHEQGFNDVTNEVLVQVNAKYFRPNELTDLCGDPSVAEKELGWTREHNLTSLIDDMLASNEELG